LIVFETQCTGPQLALAGEFGLRLLELTQAQFPFRFQPPGDEPVLGIDSTISTLCALRFIARPFNRQTPLPQRRIVVGFELLCSV
jgi:hypothetical protein